MLICMLFFVGMAGKVPQRSENCFNRYGKSVESHPAFIEAMNAFRCRWEKRRNR